MKPYDEKAKCPKCGHTSITVYHCTRYWCSESRNSTEHMHRTCGRCNYGWLEAPIDAAPRPEPTP